MSASSSTFFLSLFCMIDEGDENLSPVSVFRLELLNYLPFDICEGEVSLSETLFIHPAVLPFNASRRLFLRWLGYYITPHALLFVSLSVS